MTKIEMYRNAIKARIRGNDVAADAWLKAGNLARDEQHADAQQQANYAASIEDNE